MNIIRKIVRKVGFDVVRYSTPKSSSEYTSVENGHFKQEPVISRDLASKALQTVGRAPTSKTFTYYQRPFKSSVAMEEAENLWWNVQGNLIEKVWVLSEPVNYAYRNKYISEAASFFKEANKKAKILDLGCGSGWFGRMIADENLEYFGMDFSSTQIQIANDKKEKSPNKDYLNYYCLNDFKQIDNLQEITGVIIHAFLHHLYWDELQNLFKELIAILPDGCKFFILEPIYPDIKDAFPISTELNLFFRALTNEYRNYLKSLKANLIHNNIFDTGTELQLNEVISESERNGFFFSPKEVPFRLGEFKNFLNKYLQLKEVFHCGVLDLETAQFIERIKSKNQQDHYSKLLFPLVHSLDQMLLRNHYFEANQDTYLFTAFKCILNKSVNATS